MGPRLPRRSVLQFMAGAAAAGSVPVGRAAAQTPKRGGTVVLLVQPDVPNLALFLGTPLPTSLVATKIYDGLLEYDFDLKPRPGLAESWTLSADGKTITFKLRQGVKFHDGKPLTSADVRFTILEVLKKHHGRGPITFRDVVDVETPDAATAIFKLSNPAPYMMMGLSGYESPIVPKHLFEGTDVKTNPQRDAPIGSGPFKFVEWKKGQYVRLDRNPEYWKSSKPYVDRLVFRYVADAATRRALMEKGEVHLAGFGAIGYSDVRHLEKLPNLAVTTKGYEMISPIVEMHFNVKKAPFDNVKVRQAVAYAIDRQFIIDHIWFGFGRKATGPLNSNFAPTGLYTKDVRSYEVADRIERAKKLLDEAGLKPGADGTRLQITIDATPYGEEWRRFGEYMQQALAAIGIKAALRYEDVPGWIRRVYTNYDFDLTLTWVSNLADPVIGIHREYHTNQIRPGAVFVNASRWSNPEADALMDKGTIEADPKQRAAHYHAFQKLVAEEVPTIWTHELLFSTIHDRKLKEVVTSPLGLYANLDSMWLDG